MDNNNYNNFDGSNNQPDAYGQPQAAQQDMNAYGQPQAAQQDVNAYGQPQMSQQYSNSAYGKSEQSYSNAYNQATQQGTTAFEQRQNAGQINYAQGYNQTSQNEGSTGYSITSMILGIISIPFCCVPIIGLILGVMAIIFGSLSITQHRAGKGMAIAGVVCGAVGSLLSIIFWIVNCVALL